MSDDSRIRYRKPIELMRYAEHITDLVGRTPLVKLNHVTSGLRATVLAKVEYFNPGGSVKDRIAAKIIDAAEASGQLQPGGTIVEPTSGNTGIGLALIAQQRGYKCVFVCPDKVAKDKRDVLSAYGAEVVVCPTAVAPADPRSYYSVSDRLAREIPGAFKPDQYSNPNGPLAHYETTGPEIWADTDGRVTHFVCGVGTGGTISGAGRYLHDVSAARPAAEGGRVVVVGADPAGSVYSGGDGRPYLVEGVGEDFWPIAFDTTVPDEIIAVSDADSFAMTRRLAREEGLLVGGSCGMAVVAALRLAEQLEALDAEAAARAVIVVLLPDSGRGYLSKIFNDAWMRSYGFLDAEGGTTAGAVLHAKSGKLPDLVHVHPTDTVHDAIEAMEKFGVSQLPVVGSEPPVKAGEVFGSVTARELLDSVFAGSATLSDPISEHIQPAFPFVGAGEGLRAVRAGLQDADALLVVADGDPIGVLTRQDLLAYLAR